MTMRGMTLTTVVLVKKKSNLLDFRMTILNKLYASVLCQHSSQKRHIRKAG
jgi:hypothetical protein